MDIEDERGRRSIVGGEMIKRSIWLINEGLIIKKLSRVHCACEMADMKRLLKYAC